MKKEYSPQHILITLQLLLIVTAKFWFLRAGSNDDATAFAWMYSPMAWLMSLFSGNFFFSNDVEISYSGFVCNFNFQSGASSASLNGCSAGGFFLAILGLSSTLALLWQRSRFAQKKITKETTEEKLQTQTKLNQWIPALLGLLSSYLFSFVVLVFYNFYIIFGSGALAAQMTLFYLKYPNVPHLPYPLLVKLLFTLCATLFFALLCRKAS